MSELSEAAVGIQPVGQEMIYGQMFGFEFTPTGTLAEVLIPEGDEFSEGAISLSGVARLRADPHGNRLSPLARVPPGELRAHLSMLPTQVSSVLAVERERAEGAGETPAFGTLNSQDETTLTELVAGTLRVWDTMFSRRYPGEVLPSQSPMASQYIIEAATAVTAIIDPSTGLNPNKSSSDKGLIIRLIAVRGPKFAQDWLDGSIIEQWLSDQVPPEKVAEWMERFTPWVRKRLARSNPEDPLAAAMQVKHNYEVTLAPANMARRLGWSLLKVERTFQASDLQHFAVMAIDDPLGAVERLGDRLDQLTDSNIAERLGWTETQVRGVFTDGRRRKLALHGRGTAVDACEAWVNGKISINAANDAAMRHKLEEFRLAAYDILFGGEMPPIDEGTYPLKPSSQ